MTQAERNYDIYDKEMLAVVKALQHWRQYLEQTKEPIAIKTDHKNLEFFAKPHGLNARQMRWLHLLSNYNFVIKYRPGIKSGKPDALSRRADHRPSEGAEEPMTLLKPSQFEEVLALYASDAEIIDRIRDEITKDEALKAVLAYFGNDPARAPTELRKQMEDYRMDEGILYRRDRIYVPANEGIKKEILGLYHDAMMAGHPGQAQTLELVSRGYYWPSMKSYVNRYVEECDPCQRNKPIRDRLKGALQPLPIPTGPWQSISYDYIPHLPLSKGYDAILVVVDRFTKMAHFIPAKTKDEAPDTAERFRQYVWKLHGLPLDTVSDRGAQFNSAFMRSLYERLGIKPKFSTAFHPQTDGQTERLNSTLEQYLRNYVSHRQDNWSTLLDVAEFAYNNKRSTSTGLSPFESNYGYNPTYTTNSTPAQSSGEANEIADRLASLHKELAAGLTRAQEYQERYYNQRHAATPEFQLGDRVWLEATNIRTQQPTRKFAPKRLGPYRIIEKISPQAYKLELPITMNIHPVFHVSLLTMHRPNTIPGRDFPEPPPAIVEGEEEYEIEKVIDSRWWHNHLQYLVRYLGYSQAHDEWLFADDLDNARELIQEFHMANPQADSPTKKTTRKQRPVPRKRNAGINAIDFVSVAWLIDRAAADPSREVTRSSPDYVYSHSMTPTPWPQDSPLSRTCARV